MSALHMRVLPSECIRAVRHTRAHMHVARRPTMLICMRLSRIRYKYNSHAGATKKLELYMSSFNRWKQTMINQTVWFFMCASWCATKSLVTQQCYKNPFTEYYTVEHIYYSAQIRPTVYHALPKFSSWPSANKWFTRIFSGSWESSFFFVKYQIKNTRQISVPSVCLTLIKEFLCRLFFLH